MHPIVSLAKTTVEEYVKNKNRLIATDAGLGELSGKKAGVFVCMKKDGELRGCIGTFLPTQDNIAQETIENSISAAVKDPRFMPVTAGELDGLTYTVDILSPPEPITDISQLDAKRYGVIVNAAGRRGLLLPDLEGVETVEQQLSIAMQKAGIPPGTQISVSRFEVVRYK